MADPHHGRLATLDYSTDGTTYTPILGRLDATYDISLATLEVTDADSGEGKEFIPDRYTVQIDANLNFEESDASQEALMDAILAFPATNLYWRFRPKGAAAGRIQFVTRGHITKCTSSTPASGVATLSFTIQGTADTTKSDQP